jgi:hypothetical protein
MSDDTVYTISGTDFTNLRISSDSRRFEDNQINIDRVGPGNSLAESDYLTVGVDYRYGLFKAAKVTMKQNRGYIQITELSIPPRVRAKGLPRFTMGIVYGIALWSEAQGVWGLVEYDKALEEMIINAGFPKHTIRVNDETGMMYFEADLDQIDYDPENFVIAD